jgi:hypothetical protein
VSNLVRLVDPEEIAAARPVADSALITDCDPLPEPAHDQIAPTRAASPTRPRCADGEVAADLVGQV